MEVGKYYGTLDYHTLHSFVSDFELIFKQKDIIQRLRFLAFVVGKKREMR